MNATRPRVIASVVVVGLGLAAAPAAAYVRARTETGAAHHWAHHCLRFELGPSLPSGFTAETFLETVQAAAVPWTSDAVACSKLVITVARAINPDESVGHDGRNVIAFRSGQWCRKVETPEGKIEEDCGPTTLLALTTTFANRKTGQLVDADIEINGIDHRWADLGPSRQRSVHDLHNALTHEIGHFIGLDHTCVRDPRMERLLDDDGDPQPVCSAATREQQDSTMYPTAEPGDIERRSLSPDDEEAVCDIYPVERPLSCEPRVEDDAGGCAAAPGRERGATGAAVAAGALALLWQRLRARRRPAR